MLRRDKTKPKLVSLAIFCLSVAVMAGCSSDGNSASDPDVSSAQTENVSPTKTSSKRQVDLSFLDKPKRAVQTPSGIKLVYDPSQDPDVREAYRAYRDSGFSNALEQEISILSKARNDSREDFKRLGCSIVRGGDCTAYHYLGCEGMAPYKGCLNLPPVAKQYNLCKINGKNHDARLHKEMPDFHDAIASYFESQCSKWKK